ncbi:MAG: O-methyltransferase [Gemmataceae bacterium]
MNPSPFDKGSSFEKFNYALRPAKNMQRKMLCEALARLSRIARLASYRYVGFGAIGFHDFCIFHQRLGIVDMTSIEGNPDETTQHRIQKNKPYSCIKMKWGMSYVVLPTLPWSRRTILWLDYEHALDAPKLGDVSLACTRLRSGSAIIVTVPADPGEVDTKGNTAERRLQELRSNVGKKNLPPDVKGSHLAKWGLATVLRRIIANRIERTLSERNAVLEESQKLRFDQLFHFHYADGKQMMSMGGLILDTRDREKLSPKHFIDLSFYRPDENAYLIENPLLTWREIKLLDERLPRSAPAVRHPKWIPEIERQRYGRVYRYFPSYSEVEN